jgi:hypothetical protein
LYQNLKEEIFRLIIDEKLEYDEKLPSEEGEEGEEEDEREELIIGIGCNSGKHRSVAMVERLSKEVNSEGNIRVITEHRDISKTKVKEKERNRRERFFDINEEY